MSQSLPDSRMDGTASPSTWALMATQQLLGQASQDLWAPAAGSTAAGSSIQVKFLSKT